MKTSQKVQLLLHQMESQPYQVAQEAHVPVQLINNLLWHNLTVGDLTLAQAERLADYWERVNQPTTRLGSR